MERKPLPEKLRDIRMNDHRFSYNNPDNLSVPVAIYTKFQKFPFNSSWNVRVLHNVPLILIISPANILNSPINSICPLVTALLIISINFSLHPLYSPFFPFLHLLALTRNFTWQHLYCLFTYIYSPLIDKELCEYWDASYVFPCVY